MVGDGANDAAALQAATCGLALLSAHAPISSAPEPSDGVEARARALARRHAADAAADAAAVAAIGEEARAAAAAGDFSRAMQAVRRLSAAQAAAAAGARARRGALRAARATHGEEQPGPLGELMERFDALLGQGLAAPTDGDSDDALATAGEASMAAPFSARPGTPLAALALLRHARAAVGHSVQMRALTCLNGLSAAGALSALHVRGVRYGRAHLVAANALGSLCGWATAFPQLRRSLARTPPLSSLREPRVAASLLLQAVTHSATMLAALALGAAEDARGPAPAEAAPAPTAGRRPFRRTATNTAVICMELAQTVAITAESVQLAHPTKARRAALARAFRLADACILLAASGLVPALSELLQLQARTSARFRAALVALVLADCACSAVCELLTARLAAARQGRRSAARASRQAAPSSEGGG